MPKWLIYVYEITQFKKKKLKMLNENQLLRFVWRF